MTAMTVHRAMTILAHASHGLNVGTTGLTLQQRRHALYELWDANDATYQLGMLTLADHDARNGYGMRTVGGPR